MLSSVQPRRFALPSWHGSAKARVLAGPHRNKTSNTDSLPRNSYPLAPLPCTTAGAAGAQRVRHMTRGKWHVAASLHPPLRLDATAHAPNDTTAPQQRRPTATAQRGTSLQEQVGHSGSVSSHGQSTTAQQQHSAAARDALVQPGTCGCARGCPCAEASRVVAVTFLPELTRQSAVAAWELLGRVQVTLEGQGRVRQLVRLRL